MSFWDDVGGIALNPTGTDSNFLTGSPTPGYVVNPVGAGTGAAAQKIAGVGGSNGVGIDPYTGQPTSPGYVVSYDPKTMNLTDYLSGKYDGSGLQAFKDQAMRKGPSQWATLAGQSNRANESNSRERSAAESNSQTAQANDRLAAAGGLSSGARERNQQEGAKNYLSMSQDLARQGNLNDMQIGMNDEQNRIQQLSSLPGMEMQQAGMFEQAKNADISNTTAENERRNAWNQNLYNQQMQSYWAGKTADQEKYNAEHPPGLFGGGGFLGTGINLGSFICTALRAHGLMSNKEAKIMSKFMWDAFFTRSDFLVWYFHKGAKAVQLADRQQFDWSRVKEHFVDEIISEMNKDKISAQNMYIERAGKFITLFLGEESHFPKDSAKPGTIKSLIKIPALLSIKGTWPWIYKYLGLNIFNMRRKLNVA